jgi:hypothetical protein
VKTTEVLQDDMPEDFETALSALPTVDEVIAKFAGRTYVPTSEVTDALLEVRLAVAVVEDLLRRGEMIGAGS